jgi:hypothetical protein
VLDAERSGRPSELNDKMLMDISEYTLVDITSTPFTSAQRLSESTVIERAASLTMRLNCGERTVL